MKTLTAISISAVLTFLISCTNNKAAQKDSFKVDTLNEPAIAKAVVSLPVSLPSDAVMGFLKWYSQHRDSLASIPLVNNASGKVFDSTKFYSVNFEGTDKYLSRLKESGYVSQNYLNHWIRYFKQAEEQFNVSPQNDGPPEGFEYDFVLLSQEVDEDLANTNKAKVLSNSIQDKNATVVLQLPSGQKLRYFLTKQGYGWLIDKVEQANG